MRGLEVIVAPTDAIAVRAVARLLPRRIQTILRAESLINDGTALALYVVVVRVAVQRAAVTRSGTAARFLPAYAGGVVIATRPLWLYSVHYLLRAVPRRPVQRTLRSGARERFPVAWAGCAGPCR
jgi:NhaP-type Na+/H+ or K+/H+ antiporter